MIQDAEPIREQIPNDASEPQRDLEAFSDYMLVQLEAMNQSIADIKSRVDQAVQLYMTIASGAAGILTLVITSGQPVPVIIGAFALIAFALGAIGTATFFRVARWQLQSERELAIRNQYHLYFGSRAPELFREFKCGYGMYFFKTRHWKRSKRDRPFLLAFGLGNAALFMFGLSSAFAAAVVASPYLSLSHNLWWLTGTTVALGSLACIAVYRVYSVLFTRTTYFIESVFQSTEKGTPSDGREGTRSPEPG